MKLDFFPKDSKILVVVDGYTFRQWDDLSINRSMSSVTGTMNLKIITDDDDVETNFIKKGASIQVYLTTPSKSSDNVLSRNRGPSSRKVQIFNGWVIGYTEALTESGYSLSLSAADLTIDLVQCSAVASNNTWTNKTLEEIVKDICKPFDVFVTGEATDFEAFAVDGIIPKAALRTELYEKKFGTFSLEPGEVAFAAISRLCRARGVMALPNEFGNLVLDTANTTSPKDITLVAGKNLFEVSRKHDEGNTYDEYTCFGQKSSNGKSWSAKNNSLKAIAKDENVKRYRPLYMRIETDSSKDVLQSRVNFEAQARAGRSEKMEVRVPGWTVDLGRDSSIGRPFRINSIIELIVNRWDFKENMMVESVTFTSNNQGRSTGMTLVDPSTYAVAPGSVVLEKSVKKIKNRVPVTGANAPEVTGALSQEKVDAMVKLLSENDNDGRPK